MARRTYGESGVVRFLWQERIAESGLPEVLDLARQFGESGLFDESEIAPIRNEFKRTALLLAKNLVARLTEDAPEATIPEPVRKRREAEFAKVREHLKQFGASLDKVR